MGRPGGLDTIDTICCMVRSEDFRESANIELLLSVKMREQATLSHRSSESQTNPIVITSGLSLPSTAPHRGPLLSHLSDSHIIPHHPSPPLPKPLISTRPTVDAQTPRSFSVEGIARIELLEGGLDEVDSGAGGVA